MVATIHHQQEDDMFKNMVFASDMQVRVKKFLKNHLKLFVFLVMWLTIIQCWVTIHNHLFG